MSLAFDDSELGMMLPFRGELNLAEYFEALLPEFREVPAADPGQSPLCTSPEGDAVLLSPDPKAPGEVLRYQGCDPASGSLRFLSASLSLNQDVKRRVLLFVSLDRKVYMGFSEAKGAAEGLLLFTHPHHLYCRKVRADRRIPMDEGHATLRRSDGRTLLCRMHDFSPSGVSFLVDQDIPPGEVLMVTFEIPECGTCETVARVVRQETLPSGSLYKYLVAVSMSLTKEQRRKAENLYLCKKGEQVKRVVGSSRSAIG
ncbi:MAG: PilZ domain-containing protein [Acidithiobacillus sp.]|nr:PilZ domain-containing protein [Acidithiobacillus sp.]